MKAITVILIILTACAVFLCLNGCSQKQAQKPTQPEQTTQQPETTPPGTAGPPAEFLNADVAAGKQIYQDKCASCHGATGKPVEAFAGQSPDFSSADYQDTPPQRIFDATKNGKGAMPAYKGQLTDKQIWDVTAYVKSL